MPAASSSATASRLRRSRRRKARLSTSTAPRPSESATGRSTTHSTAIRTRCTTRSRPTPPCLVELLRRLGSVGRCQLDLGDRGRAPRRCCAVRHRVHRRRQVARTSSSAPCPWGSRRSTSNRRASSSASRRFAKQAGRPVRVAIRVNPDIDAGSHPHISTGLKINKFGVPARAARELAATLRDRPSLSSSPSTCTSGRRSRALEPLRQRGRFAAAFARDLVAAGIRLEYLDLGGGLGIAYDERDSRRSARVRVRARGRNPPDRAADRDRARTLDRRPGRCTRRARRRPQAARRVQRVRRDRRRDDRADASGALRRVSPHRAGAAACRRRTRCTRLSARSAKAATSSAAIARLPPLAVGDLVAIRDAGAYGSAMASNYNRRPLPVEVLVDDGRWRVIRRRQTVDDLLGLEAS